MTVQEVDNSFNFDAELESLPPHLQSRVRAAAQSVGRPSKFRDDWIPKMLLMFANGATVAQYCAQIGIARQSFYRIIKTNDKLRDTYKMAQGLALAFYHDIHLRVLNGDNISQAQFLVLESSYKRRFAAAEHGYQLPDLNNQESESAKVDYIFAAVAENNLTIEHASMLLGAMKNANEHLKLDELEKKLNKYVAEREE